jgi:hypothetical protein
MADGFNAPSYVGGQLLASGLSQFGQGIGGGLGEALQRYHQEHQAQLMADETAYNLTQTPSYDGKPVLSKGAYERYMAASGSQHAAKLGGILQALQVGQQAFEQASKRRLETAHANYLTAAAAQQFAGGGGPGGPAPRGKVWSDELAGWATPAQADAARRRATPGQLMQNYGLTPAQILDSKQHEGGRLDTDPKTGKQSFVNDPNGDQIRIGGPTGVVMPKAEHEVYKRQLSVAGAGAPGAAAPRAGAGAGTVRVRSPQGVVGTIPANQLPAALNAGYRQMGPAAPGAQVPAQAPARVPANQPSAQAAPTSIYGPLYDAQGNLLPPEQQGMGGS